MKSAFLKSVRDCIRKKHYSIKTEQTYLYWITYFIRHHNLRHPKEMGAVEIGQFLDFLALKKQVAPGARKVVLDTVIFMDWDVLRVGLGDFYS